MLRLLPCASLALLLAVPQLRAADIHVPGDHPTIQAAIEASVNGDTIHVAAGTWPGALDTLDRGITIAGAGAESTIIDGLGAPQVVTTGNAVELRDLTITGGIDGAVNTSPSVFATLILRRCTVRDLSGHGATGRVQGTDSSFLDNGGWGIQTTFGQHQNATRCFFKGNGLGGLRAVASHTVISPFWDAPTITVQDSIFVGDTLQASAFSPQNDGRITIDGCSLLDSSLKVLNGWPKVRDSILRGPAAIVDLSPFPVSIEYSNVQGFAGIESIDADPLWADPANDDFSLLPGSPCINTGDWVDNLSGVLFFDVDGSKPDMGAVTYDAWTELGTGAGQLAGTGPMLANEPLTLELSGLVNGTQAWLVVGFSELASPFKGGTLWPQPDLVAGPMPYVHGLPITIVATWPAGLPSGSGFTSQFWWADAGAPQGWASSNGLRGTQP